MQRVLGREVCNNNLLFVYAILGYDTTSLVFSMVCLRTGAVGDTLDKLRLLRFHQKVATSTRFVQPVNLPPTSSAAKYHCLRVYLQVQIWKGESRLGPHLHPQNLGCKAVDGKGSFKCYVTLEGVGGYMPKRYVGWGGLRQRYVTSFFLANTVCFTVVMSSRPTRISK